MPGLTPEGVTFGLLIRDEEGVLLPVLPEDTTDVVVDEEDVGFFLIVSLFPERVALKVVLADDAVGFEELD